MDPPSPQEPPTMDTSAQAQSRMLFADMPVRQGITFLEGLDGIAMGYPSNMKLTKHYKLRTKEKFLRWEYKNIINNAEAS